MFSSKEIEQICEMEKEAWVSRVERGVVRDEIFPVSVVAGGLFMDERKRLCEAKLGDVIKTNHGGIFFKR